VGEVERILIVSQYFSPDITAAAHRLTDLRNFLQGQGQQVDVITSFPHKVKIQLQGEPEPDIVRVKLPVGATSTFARLWEQSLFAAKALAAYLVNFRKRRYKVVIASSPPLFVGVVGYVLSRWTGAKFILDVRDIWPGSVAAAGIAGDSSLPIKIASRIERWLYRVADCVTCVSQPMKAYLENFIESSKVRVVYNGVSSTELTSVSEQSRIRGRENASLHADVGPDKGTERRLCLVYAGNIGLVQDIDVLIEALKYTHPETIGRLRVRIIGGGPERSRLEAMVASDPVASKIVSFEGPYPKAELTRILVQSADALFVHLRSDPILDRTIPSKVFDACLFNVPIVYGLSGEGRDILASLSGTLAFQQGSPRSLASALDELVQNYERYYAGAREHRSFVERHFTREVCFRPLLDIVL